MEKSLITPLSIISIFFSFTEIIAGYAVTSTSGLIQICLTIFVIGYPTFVGVCFFTILWHRPKNFYAPQDFKTDEAYLKAQESRVDPTSTAVVKDIRTIPHEIMTSAEFIRTVREIGPDEKEEIVKSKMEDAAKRISENIIGSNFFTVLLGSNPKIKTTYPINYFQDFNKFLDTIYFWLHDNGYPVRPFHYGNDWILINSKTREQLISSRILTNAGFGHRVEDNRPLSAFGISPGTTLEVQFLKPSP